MQRMQATDSFTKSTMFSMIICCVMFSGSARASSPGDDVLRVATYLAISADSLVVTGIVDGQPSIAEQILHNRDHAAELRSKLATQKVAIQTLKIQIIELTHALRLDPENNALVADYDAIVLQLTQESQQLESLRNQLLEIAFDGLSPSVAELLFPWSQAARYRVPPEFRVLNLPEEQWKTIEVALRAEARANRLNLAFVGEQAALLDQVRTHPDVTEAKYRLEVQLDTIQAIFAQYGA